jgi:hypothetical protein
VRAGTRHRTDEHQLDLYDRARLDPDVRSHPRRECRRGPLCAACRAKEARYGFFDEDSLERPRTLCFECFRLEIARRQERADALIRARNAAQLELPLSERLNRIDLRRRRALIAARRAAGF